jgi:hypothetical protein
MSLAPSPTLALRCPSQPKPPHPVEAGRDRRLPAQQVHRRARSGDPGVGSAAATAAGERRGPRPEAPRGDGSPQVRQALENQFRNAGTVNEQRD